MTSDQSLPNLLHSGTPIIMGIVNITPDSFYDGGYSLQALDQQLFDFDAANVDIIDLGAESSRPGSKPISATEEISRLTPALSKIKNKSNAFISIDTYKPETAAFALSNGADLINDITGGESQDLLNVVAEHNAGIILMHKQGTPESMQNTPKYKDVVLEIKDYLARQIERATSAGVSTIAIDPGIGFGKSLDHNLTILKQLDEFKSLGCPILIGTSNKSFIGHLTGAGINDRIPGSIASALSAYEKGARIFRVHNVKETRQALTIYEAINE